MIILSVTRVLDLTGAPSTDIDLTRRVFLMFLSSHSGMLVTLLLLLGCSPLTLAENEDTLQELWDDCKYNRVLYPQIFTIATACNGIPECLNGLDEKERVCNTDSVTTPILVGALFLVLGLFLGLKMPHYIEFHKNKIRAKPDQRKVSLRNSFSDSEKIQEIRRTTEKLTLTFCIF